MPGNCARNTTCRRPLLRRGPRPGHEASNPMGYPLASWTSQGRLANCWRAGTVPDLLRCKARRNLDDRPSTGPRVRTLRKRRILPPGFLRKQFGLVPHPRPEHRSERPGSERGSNQSVRRQRTQRKPIRTTASTHFSDVHVCQRRNRDSPSNPHRASSSFTMRRTLSSGPVHPFVRRAPNSGETPVARLRGACAARGTARTGGLDLGVARRNDHVGRMGDALTKSSRGTGTMPGKIPSPTPSIRRRNTSSRTVSTRAIGSPRIG